MPTVWSENDLITAEKLNNTGIDDVLDLGVLDIDLSQDNAKYEGNLTDEQIEKLEKCKFVKFTTTVNDITIEVYIPLVQKTLSDVLYYTFFAIIDTLKITCNAFKTDKTVIIDSQLTTNSATSESK